ncbi:PKD domain-containing protein [Sediminibacter sp. Hel_I_10]|uniref:PKD domain-containing protein n=1 Tax=Sediminibacter sp. Hel_I_10 TaxID=1392490 RepID=UPI0012DE27D0|nr:PKD domain-containing protein [Sediminibacter sp. Hel_I_10]
MRTLKFIARIMMIGVIIISTGCADDDLVATEPTAEDAEFTFSFDPENPNRVVFSATPSNKNWYTHWDFGDNSSSEGYEANKVFLRSGDYDVRFKVFTDGGTAESIQTVVINQNFQGPNFLLNGEFNGSDEWTVLPITDGVNVNFTGDQAVWTGGGGGQVGIYQAVHVEANVPYQINMEVSGSGLTDSWYEVYIGSETPIPGQDYNDGGIRLGLSTWGGCGNEPFEGFLSEISCVGEGGGLVQFTTAGTVYLVIRGGGANYGSSGLTLDNASFSPLLPGIVYTPPLFLPDANFTYSVTDDLTVEFTNTSSNADGYVWDFGDDAGTSTDENPTYTYASEGVYTVKLTATNSDGSDESLRDIIFGDSNNLITNGTFTDEGGWTVINQWETNNTNGSVIIEDGVAKWINNADWAHLAIFQSVDLVPGTYQFDMDVDYAGINQVYGEVYLGADMPVEGTPTEGIEYNGDFQVLKAINWWDCGASYEGSAVDGACDPETNPGRFEITTEGTYYLLFRCGGQTYGPEGVIIDNVSLVQVN